MIVQRIRKQCVREWKKVLENIPKPIVVKQNVEKMIGYKLNETMRLSDKIPVESGNDRFVYEISECPGVLLKVPKPIYERRLSPIQHYFFARFPLMKTRGLIAEYKQYIDTIHAVDDDLLNIPLPIMHGFVQTDIGPASVVEKITGADGELAPNIDKMIKKNQHSVIDLQALNRFAIDLLKHKIITTDLNTRNIVFGTRNGRKQFVLVDGIGDNFALRIRHLSHAITKLDQSKKLRRIGNALELKWCSKKWIFSM